MHRIIIIQNKIFDDFQEKLDPSWRRHLSIINSPQKSPKSTLKLTWMIRSLLSLLAPCLLKSAQLAPITIHNLRHVYILRSCLISARPHSPTVHYDPSPMHPSSSCLDCIERQVGQLNLMGLGITYIPGHKIEGSSLAINLVRQHLIPTLTFARGHSSHSVLADE